MKRGVSIFLVVTQLTFALLGCCAFLCVHSDGQAFLEWVGSDSACQLHSKTVAVADASTKSCTDYPLISTGIHVAPRPLLNLHPDDAPRMWRLAAITSFLWGSLRASHSMLSSGSAPPGYAFSHRSITEQLRTVVLVC